MDCCKKHVTFFKFYIIWRGCCMLNKSPQNVWKIKSNHLATKGEISLIGLNADITKWKYFSSKRYFLGVLYLFYFFYLFPCSSAWCKASQILVHKSFFLVSAFHITPRSCAVPCCKHLSSFAFALPLYFA